MDYYSILDNSAQAVPQTAPADIVSSTPLSIESKEQTLPRSGREALRFPGEDGGKSLSEMAQRDLDATLQLLAERAQYITGASGAAIALREGETMICCASAGPSAPELGAHLQTDSGLSAESVRTRQILRCDDAENDPRVNRDSCRTFGVASVVVMPLVRGEEVYGVFELLSGRPHAFEERDFVALNRLSEMIQTAVEHAEAARRAEVELGGTAVAPATIKAAAQPTTKIPESGPARQAPEIKRTAAPVPSPSSPSLEEIAALSRKADLTELAELDLGKMQADADASAPISTIAFGNLRRCEACGFPVSEGRRLCLDCEAATPGVPATEPVPEFFSEHADSNQGWVQSHMYLIATVLIVAATIAVLIWRF